MPAKLEKKLKREAAAKGYKGARAGHFVYGTLNRLGLMRGNKETAKGKAMDKKQGG